MFFDTRMAVAFGVTFPRTPCLDRVLLRSARDRNATWHGGKRMDVHRAIRPRPPPWRVVDDERPLTPDESCRSPAPWRERGTNADAIAKTDRAGNHEAWPRRREDHCG